MAAEWRDRNSSCVVSYVTAYLYVVDLEALTRYAVCAVVYTIDREVETCTFDKRRNTMQLSRQVSRVHQPQSYVHQLTDLHRVDVESIKNNKFHR